MEKVDLEPLLSMILDPLFLCIHLDNAAVSSRCKKESSCPYLSLLPLVGNSSARHLSNFYSSAEGLQPFAGKLHIWEIDRQNRIQKAITHKVGLLPVLYLHDFQVTKNWYATSAAANQARPQQNVNEQLQ